MRFILLLLISAFCLSSCVTSGVHVMGGLLPMPKPQLDDPFHSTTYYNNKYNVNIQSAKHSMQKEREQAVDVANACTKMASMIKINGSSGTCKPHTKILDRAKKIGDNDYVIACSKVPVGEKQKDEGYCWAACSQFLIAANFHVRVEQEAIVTKIKKGSPKGVNEQAGSVMDAMTALGFGGVTYMPNGSEIILVTLADGQPVMIGLAGTGDEPGHAVVIVGARFSFPKAAIPHCGTCSQFSFTELEIYDPWTGITTIRPAEEIENKLDFILTYDTIEV
ncbi:MAG TPA: hypothetical protein DIU49_06520 [Desulfovibrio sp.]|nr:hypothetical protein [Desulfovibrio sp.]